MRLLRFLNRRFLVVFFLSLGLLLTPAFIKQVRAADTPTPTPPPHGDPTPTPLVIKSGTPRNTYEIAGELIDEYEAAITDCDTPSLECLVHNIYQFTMIETYYQIKGGSDENSGQSGSALPTSSKTAYTGAINGIFSLIGAMYTHPIASSRTYIADVASSLHIAPPAYAQGVGFASLNPILNIWKTFRNIAYLFFVVIFIVIGFMIMFRAKVGQAAVTAQQAIPNVIIALILVTFSYAIAGFVIDLMYLSMTLIQGLFQPDFGGRSAISMNFIDLVITMFTATTGWGNGGGIGGAGQDIVSKFLENAGAGSFVTSVGGFIGGLTLTVVIAIAILIAAFKLFFDLLRAYATAVIHIVLAPLELMMGAIPGQNVFVKWFKSIVGNLLPFPTVLFVLVLYEQFTSNTLKAQQGGFIPPFMFGSGQGDIIAYVMGLALMLALPEITKKVRESVAGTGGIGEMIASAAGGRLKQGWEGAGPVKFISGKNTAKVLTGGLAAGAGAAIGGGSGFLAGTIKGGGSMSERLKRGAKWGLYGAGGGAATPIVVPPAYKMVKGVVRKTYEQGVDAAGKGAVSYGKTKFAPWWAGLMEKRGGNDGEEEHEHDVSGVGKRGSKPEV